MVTVRLMMLRLPVLVSLISGTFEPLIGLFWTSSRKPPRTGGAPSYRHTVDCWIVQSAMSKPKAERQFGMLPSIGRQTVTRTDSTPVTGGPGTDAGRKPTGPQLHPALSSST